MCNQASISKHIFSQGTTKSFYTTRTTIYFIPNLKPIDSRANGSDRSSDIPMQNGWETRRNIGYYPLANFIIDRIDAGCRHANEDGIGQNFRDW